MKTLNDLHAFLEDNEYFEVANLLALIRYKASMWDKYQREARIHKDLMQAIDVTENVQEFRKVLEENKQELADVADSIMHPHAHDDLFKEENYRVGDMITGEERAFHDFEPAAKEFEPHKDATGTTYTGHDEEDIPGEARKGEN